MHSRLDLPPEEVGGLIVPENEDEGISGCFARAVRNALKYKIMVVPSRGTSVMNIINKTILNARGKPNSWIRFGPSRGTGKFASAQVSLDETFTG